jgi:hypothetical protein
MNDPTHLVALLLDVAAAIGVREVDMAACLGHDSLDVVASLADDVRVLSVRHVHLQGHPVALQI